MFFRGFPPEWETIFFLCLFKQQIKLQYNSYYSKKFIFEFVNKTVLCKCMCISMCCDLLLKLLYTVSEDFSKVVSDFILVVTGSDD